MPNGPLTTDMENEEATIISIQGLRLDAVRAPNIWGDLKDQPALLNVKITLRSGFDSAASADALDDSTIHYGELAKSIRAACSLAKNRDTVLEAAVDAATKMTQKPRVAEYIASRLSVELVLPKASAYGAALSLEHTTLFRPDPIEDTFIVEHRRTFHCKGLRIMTLIGVNASERRGKQPLVVDFSVDHDEHWSEQSHQSTMVKYSSLERVLVDVIERTEFETLESLADHVVKEMRKPIMDRVEEEATAEFLHLRFEKPAAIPFADCPVIEVRRRLT
jgi:FolB domain-containing protein